MIVREYEKDEITVDRVPLVLMAGMALVSLALAASVSFGFVDKTAVASEARAAAGAVAVAQRPLRFFDESDGTVRAEDGSSGEVLARFSPGEGGFIRASVRSLVHQRRIRGHGPAVAFELTEWSTGALTLLDPVTGRSVEAASFGPDNRRVFADMLEREAR